MTIKIESWPQQSCPKCDANFCTFCVYYLERNRRYEGACFIVVIGTLSRSQVHKLTNLLLARLDNAKVRVYHFVCKLNLHLSFVDM